MTEITISLQFFLKNSKLISMYWSKSLCNWVMIVFLFLIFSAMLCIQLLINGSDPSAPGSMYTMPHLLTVAGDATAKSSTSNIIVMCGVLNFKTKTLHR